MSAATARPSYSLRLGPLSTRLARRPLLVVVALFLLTAVAVVVALVLGPVPASLPTVWAALTGSAPRPVALPIVEWRLPRALASAVFGAMLGVSGALFQTVTRNPLGSPDVIGFTTGAHTGGLVVLLLAGSGFAQVASGSLLGGLATAAVVLALSQRGQAQGFRLIVAGIALTSMLAALDTYLILTAHLDLAMIAATWGAGSLNGLSWAYVGPAIALGVGLLAVGALVVRPVALLDLGDDTSAALGGRPGRTRLVAVVYGVALAALVTAVAGPIAFVALAAPQIGRRLARTGGTPLLPAAATGAALLAWADLAAQHAVPGVSVPVGVVTVCGGGIYLLGLVVAETRRGAL